MKHTHLALFLSFAAARSFAGVFPDCSYSPPPGWHPSAGDPVFVLSQDYPTTNPASPEGPWKAIDFHAQPAQYMQAVIDYCYDGNLAVQFRGQENAVRKWYHAPWLHKGPNPREFTHGLTAERITPVRALAATQTSTAKTFAVGLYNAPGGFTIGRVWADKDHPDPSKAVFPEGTVTFKLLFSTTTKDQVPYLDGAPEWIADTNRSNDATQIRATKVRLVQVDFAVKDNRSNEGGWIFGTFQYDKNVANADPWRRITPVMLMWGDDPTFTPADYDPAHGHIPQESAINLTSPTIAYRTSPAGEPGKNVLGWAGRGNGPIDNPKSSCLSCHSLAAVPRATSLFPPEGNGVTDQTKLHWFRNLAPGEPFVNDGHHPGLDFSLQLAFGIDNHAHAGAAQPHLRRSDGSRDPSLR